MLALNTADLLRDGDRYGNFRSPEFRRAFAFYVGLYRDGLAPTTSGTEISNLYQEFASGRFASYITGPWNIGEFRRRLPDDRQGDWATAPIPGPEPGTPGVSVAGGSSLVVFERSEHPAQAWALVEFLSRLDVQVEFNRLTGNLPPRESVWETSGLADDEFARAFRDQLRHVRPTPKVPEQERVAQTLREYAEFAARGEMTVDQALARDGRRRRPHPRKASLAAVEGGGRMTRASPPTPPSPFPPMRGPGAARALPGPVPADRPGASLESSRPTRSALVVTLDSRARGTQAPEDGAANDVWVERGPRQPPATGLAGTAGGDDLSVGSAHASLAGQRARGSAGGVLLRDRPPP